MINRLRIEYATEIFLAEMRRQFVLMNPNVDVPVRTLRDYPENQRSALMKAVEKSIKSSAPAADAFFETWTENRNQESK
jgi:hypothetical protein